MKIKANVVSYRITNCEDLNNIRANIVFSLDSKFKIDATKFGEIEFEAPISSGLEKYSIEDLKKEIESRDFKKEIEKREFIICENCNVAILKSLRNIPLKERCPICGYPIEL